MKVPENNAFAVTEGGSFAAVKSRILKGAV